MCSMSDQTKQFLSPSNNGVKVGWCLEHRALVQAELQPLLGRHQVAAHVHGGFGRGRVHQVVAGAERQRLRLRDVARRLEAVHVLAGHSAQHARAVHVAVGDRRVQRVLEDAETGVLIHLQNRFDTEQVQNQTIQRTGVILLT